MAKLVVGLAADDYQFLPDLLRLEDPSGIATKSETQFTYTNDRGDTVAVTGTGFVYSGNTATTGTIATVTVTNAGSEVLFSITEVGQPLKAFTEQLVGAKDSFLAMRVLLAGNDTMTGSAESDVMGVPSPGDDVVTGLGGDDFLMGDSGKDQYFGGDGYDHLSYHITMFIDDGKGITLKVSKGQLKDPWGDVDSFAGFEGFRGTRYNDKFIGDGNSNEFSGLKGKDVFDGKGGFDTVAYHDDASFPEGIGGFKAIKVDLTKSKKQVTDGFGDKDTVKNIEGFRGTRFNDKFKGTDGHQNFSGLDGKDSYDGGEGFDVLSFRDNDWNGATVGVIVDIGKGKVINDGFGNKESFKSMEKIDGTKFGDRLIGSSKVDSFSGDGGNDIMTGKGGGDQFVFFVAPDNNTNSDTITDFNQSEGDKIAFYKPNGYGVLDGAGGKLATSEFVANKGGKPTTADQHIVYDTDTGKLFLDPDGNASNGDQVLIATLQGAPNLNHKAFQIWNTFEIGI